MLLFFTQRNELPTISKKGPKTLKKENNPKISTSHGKDTILDHMAGQYPFVVYRRENVARKLIDSRGVPDIVHTWQNEIKGQRDMLYDRASLMVFPPLTVPARMGQVYRLQPGSDLAGVKGGVGRGNRDEYGQCDH